MNSDTSNTQQLQAAAILLAQDILSESIDLLYGCRLIAQAYEESGCSEYQPEFEPFITFHQATRHIQLSPDWKSSVMSNEKQELQSYEAKHREELWEACKGILREFC